MIQFNLADEIYFFENIAPIFFKNTLNQNIYGSIA